jgi:hypothetical protein
MCVSGNGIHRGRRGVFESKELNRVYENKMDEVTEGRTKRSNYNGYNSLNIVT